MRPVWGLISQDANPKRRPGAACGDRYAIAKKECENVVGTITSSNDVDSVGAFCCRTPRESR